MRPFNVIWRRLTSPGLRGTPACVYCGVDVRLLDEIAHGADGVFRVILYQGEAIREHKYSKVAWVLLCESRHIACLDLLLGTQTKVWGEASLLPGSGGRYSVGEITKRLLPQLFHHPFLPLRELSFLRQLYFRPLHERLVDLV